MISNKILDEIKRKEFDDLTLKDIQVLKKAYGSAWYIVFNRGTDEY